MSESLHSSVPSLTDRQFELLSAVAHKRWGLHMPAAKRGLVSSRASRLMRRLGYASLDQLCAELEAPESSIDPLELFDVLSTNHTSFFREPRHFEALVREVVRPAASSRGGELRLWSAGCSNGAEPYSMSIAVSEALRDPSALRLRILATDLSTTILARARHGQFPAKALEGLGPQLVTRYFQRESDETDGRVHYSVRSQVRRPVTFALLNLLDPWRMRGPFDAIFCRNVMIYFDVPTKSALVERFVQLLRPGGLFFVGGSESLNGIRSDLDNLEPNVYRKRGGEKA